MRKTTKGAIAVGAGVALLLGGAGTMALWNDSVGMQNATTVTAGNLDIEAKTPTGQTWTWGTPAVTFDPASSKIVPGDVVTYTQVFSVTAQGDHLKAAAAVTGLDLTGDLKTAVPTLATTTTLSYAVTAGTGTAAVTGGGSGIDFTANSGVTSYDVTVVVTITFPSATTGQAGTTLSADLSAATVTLGQV